MVINGVQGAKYHGFYRGIVKKHLPHGKCKVWIPSIYPYTYQDKPDFLPDAEQATPIWAGGKNGDGVFGYPDISSIVWCFFQNDDINFPVIFAQTLGGTNAFGQYEFIKGHDENVSNKQLITYGQTHVELFKDGMLSALVIDPAITSAEVNYFSNQVSARPDLDLINLGSKGSCYGSTTLGNSSLENGFLDLHLHGYQNKTDSYNSQDQLEAEDQEEIDDEYYDSEDTGEYEDASDDADEEQGPVETSTDTVTCSADNTLYVNGNGILKNKYFKQGTRNFTATSETEDSTETSSIVQNSGISGWFEVNGETGHGFSQHIENDLTKQIGEENEQINLTADIFNGCSFLSSGGMFGLSSRGNCIIAGQQPVQFNSYYANLAQSNSMGSTLSTVLSNGTTTGEYSEVITENTAGVVSEQTVKFGQTQLLLKKFDTAANGGTFEIHVGPSNNCVITINAIGEISITAQNKVSVTAATQIDMKAPQIKMEGNVQTTGTLTVGGMTTMNGGSTVNGSAQVNGVETVTGLVNAVDFRTTSGKQMLLHTHTAIGLGSPTSPPN